MLGEVSVVLQQQLAGLLVERGLGEGLNEQAAHDDQHVAQPHLGRPVALEHVYADLARLGHVRVEDLGQEVACAEGAQKGE